MPDQMKFGLTSMNMGATSYPDALVRVAQAAETAGFDSLWAGEHSVLAESSPRIPATTRWSPSHSWQRTRAPFGWAQAFCFSRSISRSSLRRNWLPWMCSQVAA